MGRHVAKIPLAASLLSTGRSQDLNKLLVALILHQQQEEDEPLIVTQKDFDKAEGFTLVVTDVSEDGALVLSVRPK